MRVLMGKSPFLGAHVEDKMQTTLYRTSEQVVSEHTLKCKVVTCCTKTTASPMKS